VLVSLYCVHTTITGSNIGLLSVFFLVTPLLTKAIKCLSSEGRLYISKDVLFNEYWFPYSHWKPASQSSQAPLSPFVPAAIPIASPPTSPNHTSITHSPPSHNSPPVLSTPTHINNTPNSSSSSSSVPIPESLTAIPPSSSSSEPIPNQSPQNLFQHTRDLLYLVCIL